VDGVLTDGSIIYSDPRSETKRFHVRDGAALKLWQSLGKQSAILSGRRSPAVDARAQETGIDHVIQGAFHKLPAYKELLGRLGLKPEQVCFIGDDVPDLAVMRHCGLAVAVADSCPEVIGHAHFVTSSPGGHGAVRETAELVLRCQGQWQTVIGRYLAETL
jgi:3-deoxy-D-manno-octulosonate 8-phosphate phosphatase (KDO 8-P phosphatase)